DEVREILAAKGYAGKDLDDLLRLITSRGQFWVDFMMREELQMHAPVGESALRSAAVTFSSFVIAGSIPLMPYLLFRGEASFAVVCAITAVTLFVVGALRAYFSRQSWIALGFEMLGAGGSAAVIAYGVGAMIRFMVS
ncbi:MAG: VIT1/CCC1 transporter family protein, partial [Candidatus Sungiibacteriota bacterium]